MNEILITVIIPVYNVEKYLERCILSIINQTYKNLEIILVDDGSVDKSPRICDEYKKKDHRIKVVHKVNGGLSDARNIGLEIASGNYIVFIDSDDYADYTMIEDAVKTTNNHNSDLVIWGYYADFIDMNEKLISTINHYCITGYYLKNEFDKIPLSSELIGILGYAWNKMYKKEILIMNNIQFNKGLSLVEDIVFNSKVLTEIDRISFLERPYIHYMQRPRETLGTKFYDNYYDLKIMAFESIESILKAWDKKENEIKSVINQMAFNELKSAIRLLVNAKNGKKKDKIDYLDALLRTERVQSYLEEYQPQNIKDKAITLLMINIKSSMLINIYSKIK